MKRILFAALVMVSSSMAMAFTDANQELAWSRVSARIGAMQNQGLQWKVGDETNSGLSIGGFIKGSSRMFVREDAGTSLWVQQDVDLGFAGKQKIEIQFNKADGRVLKMLVNGQEQSAGDPSDVEVIEMKEDSVTVPAGAFNAIYVKMRNKKDNSIQEGWINPKEVPMSGIIKVVGETQFGKFIQELKSFKFATL